MTFLELLGVVVASAAGTVIGIAFAIGVYLLLNYREMERQLEIKRGMK